MIEWQAGSDDSRGTVVATLEDQVWGTNLFVPASGVAGFSVIDGSSPAVVYLDDAASSNVGSHGGVFNRNV